MKKHPVELLYTFIKNLNIKVDNPISLLRVPADIDTRLSPLGVKSKNIGKNTYEVVAECIVEFFSLRKEKIVATIAFEFSGIFNIFSDHSNLKTVLYQECAGILYPFLRAEMSHLSSKIGARVDLPYLNFKEQFKKIEEKAERK